MTIAQEAQALFPDLVQWRRRFHRRAEGGYELTETLAFIAETLDTYGIAYTRPCVGTLIVDLGAGPQGMVLRADMDALPMPEESGLPFASETAFTHACGHDFHAAMLLGAALILHRHEGELPGRTRLIFQPDEEGATGAEKLLAHGVLDGDFRGAFALHVSPMFTSGVLFSRNGALYAACDDFTLTVRGKSAHAAAPHDGCDAIFAAVQIYNALQGLISRECPADETAVLSICTIHGGTAANVIADEVQLQGTLRTYSDIVRENLLQRLHSLCQGIGDSLRCETILDVHTSMPAVINDATLNTRILTQLSAEAPHQHLAVQTEPFAWSEDFGHFRAHLPVVMMTLGAKVSGCQADIHHANVLFDEAALPVGVLAHCAAALAH